MGDGAKARRAAVGAGGSGGRSAAPAGHGRERFPPAGCRRALWTAPGAVEPARSDLSCRQGLFPACF